MSIRPRRSLINTILTRPNVFALTPRFSNQVWLDKNENIDPELLLIADQVKKSIPPINLAVYPEVAHLYKKIAVTENIEPESLLLTSGSDGGIRMAFEAFIEHGDKVIHTSPTFAMYSVYCEMFGANSTVIDYTYSNTGPNLDLGKVIQSLNTHKPKLFCLPNPDSPTGAVVSGDVLQEILKVCENSGTIFLVDEAYYPFYGKTILPSIKSSRNLIVLRTFSKAWAAAGLRIGFAAAHPDTIRFLHLMRPMYEVATFSIEYIYKMYDYKNFVDQAVLRVNSNKEKFKIAMENLGFRVFPTEGNFINVLMADQAELVNNVLQDKFLYRKSFDHPSLKGCVRFSIGSEDVMNSLTDYISDAVRGR